MGNYNTSEITKSILNSTNLDILSSIVEDAAVRNRVRLDTRQLQSVVCGGDISGTITQTNNVGIITNLNNVARRVIDQTAASEIVNKLQEAASQYIQNLREDITNLIPNLTVTNVRNKTELANIVNQRIANTINLRTIQDNLANATADQVQNVICNNLTGTGVINQSNNAQLGLALNGLVENVVKSLIKPQIATTTESVTQQQTQNVATGIKSIGDTVNEGIKNLTTGIQGIFSRATVPLIIIGVIIFIVIVLVIVGIVWYFIKSKNAQAATAAMTSAMPQMPTFIPVAVPSMPTGTSPGIATGLSTLATQLPGMISGFVQ